jgi:hypothetical protein
MEKLRRPLDELKGYILSHKKRKFMIEKIFHQKKDNTKERNFIQEKGLQNRKD